MKKSKLIIILFIMFVQHSRALSLTVNDSSTQPAIAGRQSIGDLNGDGYADIFMSGLPKNTSAGCIFQAPNCNSHFGNKPAKILINNLKGGFIEIPQSEEFSNPEGIPSSSIADLDNDGDNDIVFSNGKVSLNNGLVEFSNPISTGLAFSSRKIITVDIDNDGISEVISSGYVQKRISLNPLRYESTTSSSIFNSNANVKALDFNSDGFKDLITYGNQNITIWVNDGTGLYPIENKIDLMEKEDLDLVCGDIDNDNDIDIVLSNGSIYKNNGELSFQKINVFNNLTYIPKKLVNYNDDPYLDLFMTVEVSNSNRTFQDVVMQNDGSGNFIGSILINEGSSLGYKDLEGVYSFSEDFNNDGLEDFITLNKSPISAKDRSGSYVSANSITDYKFPYFESKSLSLYINSPMGLNVSNINRTEFSESHLIDFDNDGQAELLFSRYDNENDNNNYNIFLRSFKNVLYTSNITLDNIQYNYTDFINVQENELIEYSLPIDFNNDSYDDLLVYIYDIFDPNHHLIKRIYMNSENGFNGTYLTVTPLLIGNIQTGDINGDGFSDIFSSGPTILVNNYNLDQDFDLINLDLFASLDNKKNNVLDINNDGFDDIVYLDRNKRLNVVYGKSNLNDLTQKILFPSRLDGFSFYDYNHDDLPDLFVLMENGSDISQYKNLESGFVFIKNYYFDLDDKPLGDFRMIDLNNDGQLEVVAHYQSTFYVYQLDSNENYQIIYKDEELNGYNASNYIFHDFDNDSMLDISIGGKIIFGRELPFLTGLHYDPLHSGHGFSLENLGMGQFFSVFYTYDESAYPEWYTSLGGFEEPELDYWNIRSAGNLVRTEFYYTNNSVTQNTADAYRGSLSQQSCSSIYGKINLHYEIGINGFGIPLTQGNWCSQPIVGYYHRPQENFSGLWWAGSDDSGWGWSISLFEREDTTDMVLVLYYYDAQGNPRWLIGQQAGFVKGQEITLDMDMVKGYSRQSTPIDLSLIPAGTISITLNEASHSLARAGVMSIDVTYPGPEGGNWIRNNIPIALFSEPR